ncbi:MAG TPA: reverse transcriptase domain-containing protein [Candidatus Cryosericum sp.]
MPLGLSEEKLSGLNHELAVARIRSDVASDFIFAPHLSSIYEWSGDALWNQLRAELKGGRYVPASPVGIEVPKSSGFSRPGTVLLPCDRLAYQIVVDALVPNAERHLDRDRVFSCVPLDDDPKGLMFKPPGDSFKRFMQKMGSLARDPRYPYVLRADVSSYFERIYQHNLVNALGSAHCDESLVSFLGSLLSCFTHTDSHGIVQGEYPSDFLGTFYLGTIDVKHRAAGIPSVRYVDDMYFFFSNERDARIHRTTLASWLRQEALSLNEHKCELAPSLSLLEQETKVTRLFEDARQEGLDNFLQNDDPYSSPQVPWDFANDNGFVDEDDAKTIELGAVRSLFSLLEEIDDSERIYGQIEKYCLSAFAKADDSIAVDYVLRQYPRRPHMALAYAVYLGSLALHDREVARTAQRLIVDPDVCLDFQLMWLCAVLTNADELLPQTLDWATWGISHRSSSVALRAVYPILLGRFGGPSQHQVLRESYADEPSEYVRAAILYASRYLPASEQTMCVKNWRNHSPLNGLVAESLKLLPVRS